MRYPKCFLITNPQRSDPIPTEHEFKWVLNLEFSKQHPHLSLLERSDNYLHIKQGYLAFSKGMTLRIRSSTGVNAKEKWYLTLKQKVGDRVVEIEKKLDERDGHDLWSACVGKVKKDRYVFRIGDQTWELDFFLKHKEIYFIQLEAELPEGAERPEKVPKFIRPHVLFEVPLTDDRFSNKRLGCVEYASQLYRNILEGKANENIKESL